MTVDLADASSTSGDPSKYDRVGTWKWLKLPPGTATKKRTRKQGKIGTTLSMFKYDDVPDVTKIPLPRTSYI